MAVILSLAATVAFAVTAVLAIKQDRDVDIFGVIVLGLIFALPVGPVILGIVTAIGGGLIRDVLSGRMTLLMRQELYAVPVCLGCMAYVLVLHFLPEQRVLGSIACIAGTFALRAAAIHWQLTMPKFLNLSGSSKQ